LGSDVEIQIPKETKSTDLKTMGAKDRSSLIEEKKRRGERINETVGFDRDH